MKTKKLVSLLLIVSMGVLIIACENKTISQTTNTITDTANDIKDEKVLPAYTFSDESTKEAAIYRYLIENYNDNYDGAEFDVTIPYMVIISEDENEVLGAGWLICYNLNGTVLEMMAGGEYDGKFHFEKVAGGYNVTQFDVVGDGSEYIKTAKEIFGDKYDEFINLDEKIKEAKRKEIIVDYVKRNNLKITAYKDYGWPEVPLN